MLAKGVTVSIRRGVETGTWKRLIVCQALGKRPIYAVIGEPSLEKSHERKQDRFHHASAAPASEKPSGSVESTSPPVIAWRTVLG